MSPGGGEAVREEEEEVAAEREGHTRARDDGEGERERVGCHPAQRIPLPIWQGPRRTEAGCRFGSLVRPASGAGVGLPAAAVPRPRSVRA